MKRFSFYASLIPIVGFIATYSFFAYHNRLIADDLAYAYYGRDFGIWDYLVHHYTTINGRFLSPLLMYVLYPIYDLNGKPILFNLISLALFGLGLYRYLKVEDLQIPERSLSILMTTMVVSSFLLTFSHFENWLWVAGVAGYILPMSLYFLASSVKSTWVRSIAFAFIATSNILMAVFIISDVVASFVLLRRFSIKSGLALCISPGLGATTILLSPGTWKRKTAEAVTDSSSVEIGILLESMIHHIERLTIGQPVNLLVAICLGICAGMVVLNENVHFPKLDSLLKKQILQFALFIVVYWVLFGTLGGGITATGSDRTNIFLSFLVASIVVVSTAILFIKGMSKFMRYNRNSVDYLLGTLLLFSVSVPSYYWVKTYRNNQDIANFSVRYDERKESMEQAVSNGNNPILISKLPETQFFRFEHLNENWMLVDFKHYFEIDDSIEVITE